MCEEENELGKMNNGGCGSWAGKKERIRKKGIRIKDRTNSLLIPAGEEPSGVFFSFFFVFRSYS